MTWFDKILKEAWDLTREALKVDLLGVSGSIVVTQVTVTTSATALPATPLTGRRCIELYNTSTTAIEVGPSGVTYGGGRPLLQDQPLSLDLTEDVPIYGITESGTADLRVTEIA